jgi:dolichol-phosphate mannosyltransferase
MDEFVYSVILPSYLEEENLRLLLPRLMSVMKGLDAPFEILIVDTVSPLDATASVCAENGVTYINRGPANTFGDAVRTGIAAAKGTWIIQMDADGSHTPEFIPSLVKVTANSDVVIASRYVEGGHTENILPLRMMSRVLNVSYALILGLKCKDVSNSFKCYRSSLLKPLHLRCDNFDIIEEILYLLYRHNKGLRVTEVPFTFKKRMFGETKRNLIAFIITYITTILKLRFLSR